LGSFLALQAIGDSQNLLVVVPKFMLALSALISMLIIPIEFILVMLGFNEVVLAFAVAFITSIVEMLLVITAGEMAIFLLLGSNVIDVIFGLFFGEVLPQMFGHISYHKAMPAVSMYSAIFALATLIGVLVAKKAYEKNKHIFATLLFIVFIIGGSLVYNIAIFFNGIDPMNQLISSYLAIYENPIYYIFWGIVGLYIAVKFVQNQKEKDTILDEVLKSLVELKNYYEGAIFTIQIDAHSLQSHLGKISYLVKHLIDAEKYLGGDGKLSIIIENNIVPDAITKENYQKILTELAHNIPQASPTILTDTLEKLLTKEFVADISLANNSTPLLFISLQSTLTLQDIDNAKKLLETSKQLNNVIFEVGCYDAEDSTLEKLNTLNEIQTDNVTKTNWVSIIELADNQNITYILESIFDRFTDYIKELNQKSK
ncbi:hypothetical protein KC980_02365, partial [candidate division WWE3 bacterium]|nr:hypothetical protein [candidate division WWE3 bacterium]